MKRATYEIPKKVLLEGPALIALSFLFVLRRAPVGARYVVVVLALLLGQPEISDFQGVGRP